MGLHVGRSRVANIPYLMTIVNVLELISILAAGASTAAIFWLIVWLIDDDDDDQDSGDLELVDHVSRQTMAYHQTK